MKVVILRFLYLISVCVMKLQTYLQVETLGMHQEWLGGRMDSYGGGYKINLLRQAIEQFRNDDKKIILFTDR